MLGRNKQLQLEHEQLKEALLDQISSLRRQGIEKDKLLEERNEMISHLRAQLATARDKLAKTEEELRGVKQTKTKLEKDLRDEKRTNDRMLSQLAHGEKMLSMVCAYRGEDERKDAARLLQENLDLEDKVLKLKQQVKWLAKESAAKETDD
mmetsp:Transcript_9138/g.26529  ORF Transcript_9138/g.26529 Transcript_9138/m.26529 type:complete len:151 (+) Transcript_9138:78-530(+)|eukprot:CAMPEP_0206033416 /NCGR_PEP_ID=MMETSP1466-20131121/642_1 /ASSEMBLY_ACC=CAM_ASM_001126 /TAXON_ID=44452 /ORGANISM="Pavlova gyrans, Strain CCMP608" /LENGTH=150 /DNA_ID=CAMNT_0053407609 /DNA_START=57 /DNA_END=509 /DNA_ORIENTATION=-